MNGDPGAELITGLVGLLIYAGVPVLLILLGLVAGGLSQRRHFRSLERRERELGYVMATDVRTFPGGSDPSRHASLVMAEVVIASDYLKSFLAGLRKIVGGELRSYHSLMVRARREALLRLKARARSLGHDAICNVRYETGDIAGMKRPGSVAMVAVTASATAYTRPGSGERAS